jgi:hypothetical protein
MPGGGTDPLDILFLGAAIVVVAVLGAGAFILAVEAVAPPAR